MPGRRDGLGMQNDAGEFVDLYVPRKCSASNRIIAAMVLLFFIVSPFYQNLSQLGTQRK